MVRHMLILKSEASLKEILPSRKNPSQPILSAIMLTVIITDSRVRGYLVVLIALVSATKQIEIYPQVSGNRRIYGRDPAIAFSTQEISEKYRQHRVSANMGPFEGKCWMAVLPQPPSLRFKILLKRRLSSLK
jgi:hypothetical protein